MTTHGCVEVPDADGGVQGGAGGDEVSATAARHRQRKLGHRVQRDRAHEAATDSSPDVKCRVGGGQYQSTVGRPRRPSHGRRQLTRAEVPLTPLRPANNNNRDVHHTQCRRN